MKTGVLRHGVPGKFKGESHNTITGNFRHVRMVSHVTYTTSYNEYYDKK